MQLLLMVRSRYSALVCINQVRYRYWTLNVITTVPLYSAVSSLLAGQCKVGRKTDPSDLLYNFPDIGHPVEYGTRFPNTLGRKCVEFSGKGHQWWATIYHHSWWRPGSSLWVKIRPGSQPVPVAPQLCDSACVSQGKSKDWIHRNWKEKISLQSKALYWKEYKTAFVI